VNEYMNQLIKSEMMFS